MFLKDFKKVLPIYLVSRLLIFLAIICSYAIELKPIPARGEKGIVYNSEINLDIEIVKKAIKNVFSSADAGWYSDIAEEGYHPGPVNKEVAKNWVFFPLFPMLLKALNLITGSSLVSGLIISNLCFLMALIIFRKLAQSYGLLESQIFFALSLICFFPTSYFFSAALTESLFLLLSLLSWYYLRNNKIITSAIIFSLLTATRPTGLLVYPAYLIELKNKKILFSLKGIFSALIALLGLASFMIFLKFHTNDPFAFSVNQEAWGRNKDSFFSLLSGLFSNPLHLMQSWDFISLNFLMALLGIAAAIYLFLKKEISLSLFLFIPIAISLYTGKLLSISRFVMVLFPLYLALPQLIKNEQAQKIVLIVFVFLLGIMSVMFGQLITAAMA